jgi:hypothetical protein
MSARAIGPLKPKDTVQTDDEIFSTVGFHQTLRDAFNRICAYVASSNGCNAKTYKPPHMKQMRAAHVLPGECGRTKASQVFLMIEPRTHGTVLRRRRRFGKRRDHPTCRKDIDATFSGWTELEASLKEWSLDWKRPAKPKTALEWGDGHALSGGLPETNRRRF